MSSRLKDFRILAFQSSRLPDLDRRLENLGGRCSLLPGARKNSLEETASLQSFTQALSAGRLDAVVFQTASGTRELIEAAGRISGRRQVLKSLAGVPLIARGPKTLAALREQGLEGGLAVQDPNTWREVVSTLETLGPLKDRPIAVQDVAHPQHPLLKALEAASAEVIPLALYEWIAPSDLKPWEQALDQMIAGQWDFLLFTSRWQVEHLSALARQRGLLTRWMESLKTLAIGSVGPNTTSACRDAGFLPDFEPDRPHWENLLEFTGRRGPDLLFKKRCSTKAGVSTLLWPRIDARWPETDAAGKKIPGRDDSVFLKACRREPVPHTPVWIMRQAGRYQRAYREIRSKVSMLELCQTPEIAAEVTLLAVDQLGTDAAILFADILLPLEAMGLNLEFAKGEGPVIDNPVRGPADLKRLRRGDAAELDYVYQTVKLVRQALRPDRALIGFAGAPFTVASYIVEGGKSKNYSLTKTLMWSEPAVWEGLMNPLVDLLIDYLNRQVDAGADALQLFDSWVGQLSPEDYRRHVLPHVQRLIAGVKPGVPVIHFGTGNPELLPLMKEAGGSVIGLDWRVNLRQAWDRLGPDVGVMGNLDPVTLYAPRPIIREEIARILTDAGNQPGHIFNLGHGVFPDLDPLHVAEVVEAVHELSRR